jgi:hypothetical protein
MSQHELVGNILPIPLLQLLSPSYKQEANSNPVPVLQHWIYTHCYLLQ